MATDGATRTPATDTGVSGGESVCASGAAAHDAGRPRPRRTLNLADRLVRVPIGFLWLGVLAIVAVPVMIYMTCLYWAARWTSALFGRDRAPRGNGADRDERVA